MATHTLTIANPSQEITLSTDGDVQVIISDDSDFSGAIFRIEYETDTSGVYIPIGHSRTTVEYSRIYTFKAGKIKLTLVGNPSAASLLVVDVK
jgi:hypothetical protein